MFLFCEHLDDKAYFIIPEEGGEPIHHQYGCVSCLQFETIGRIEVVPEPLASQLVELLGCNPAEPAVVRLKTGLPVNDVLGEGLARLEDGRYVAVANCD
jgi:hypothetical protein